MPFAACLYPSHSLHTCRFPLVIHTDTDRGHVQLLTAANVYEKAALTVPLDGEGAEGEEPLQLYAAALVVISAEVNGLPAESLNAQDW